MRDKMSINVPVIHPNHAPMLRKYLNRLEYLDYLIGIRGTGSPKNLAKRFQISERSIYCYIEVLKNLGAPVKYSKHKKTYYYVTDGHVSIKFFEKKEE
jgi:predicted DNA-binding transcriptional regulator YafY